jgi:lysophospholipase L1-like esterase
MATLMVVMSLVPGAAVADEQPDAPVYLSLGTSLAAGSMADADGNTTIKRSNKSYTNQLFRRIKGHVEPDITHVKLGCDGETTDQFVGGVNLYGEHSACQSDYSTGNQLGDALQTLQTRNVALVTIDLGANDITQAQQACLGDPACIVGEIGPIATDIATIVGTLRVVGGYTGPIIGMTYYNPQVAAAIGFYPGNPGPLTPDLAFAGLTDQLAQGFNGALTTAYNAAGADVADVYSAFNSGDFGDDAPLNGVPDNVDRVCALTSMCPDTEGVNANIHPNRRGYKVMAKTFFRIVKRMNVGS